MQEDAGPARETTGILQVPSKGPGLPYLLSPGVHYLGRSLAQFIYDGHKLLLHINTIERTEGESLPRALTVIPGTLAAAPTRLSTEDQDLTLLPSSLTFPSHPLEPALLPHPLLR